MTAKTKSTASTYIVQTGRDRGKYKTKLTTQHLGRAFLVYEGYLVHSGGKKRLLRDGKVIKREITPR